MGPSDSNIKIQKRPPPSALARAPRPRARAGPRGAASRERAIAPRTRSITGGAARTLVPARANQRGARAPRCNCAPTRYIARNAHRPARRAACGARIACTRAPLAAPRVMRRRRAPRGARTRGARGARGCFPWPRVADRPRAGALRCASREVRFLGLLRGRAVRCAPVSRPFLPRLSPVLCMIPSPASFYSHP